MRMTYQTALVLKAVASGFRYGFDIMDVTDLPSGTVYPVLRRLERAGHLRSRWEDWEPALDDGRPRRKLYELTELGLALLPAAGERLAAIPAFLSRPGVHTEAGGDS